MCWTCNLMVTSSTAGRGVAAFMAPGLWL